MWFWVTYESAVLQIIDTQKVAEMLKTRKFSAKGEVVDFRAILTRLITKIGNKF